MGPVKVLYGHLLRDLEDDGLFIRLLGRGTSCQTQLMHNYTTSRTCVRKTLRRPALPTGLTRGAVEQFDRDVRVARLLHAAAAEDGFDLRVPELVSAASTPQGYRVSYWGLCNGGSVSSFLERCSKTGSVLPVGLALHILVQTLETLDFMYTKLDTPIFHGDLHGDNLMLHFTAGHAIPNVYVIDFGLATHCPPVPGDPASSTVVPDWDITDVLALLCDHLAPLTLPQAKVRELHAAAETAATVAGHEPPPHHTTMAAYLRRPPDSPDNDDSDHAALRAAYRQLHELQRTFDAQQAAALDTAPNTPSSNAPNTDLQQTTPTSTSTPTPTPPRMSIPSLQPAIAHLRRTTATALRDVEHAAQHGAFREGVLRPAREGALALGAARPKLCRNVGDLLAWLGGPDGVGVGIGAGPWDVVAVEEGQEGFVVREVLLGLVGEGEEG